MILKILSFIYKNFTKKLFFTIDPETFHNLITTIGEFIGRFNFFREIFTKILGKRYKSLKQEFFGIKFEAPLGLSAGYDYEAKVVNLMGPFGFGFNTVGTITNEPYEGNKKPRLGRLPKSKSIMVNKGFKNRGARMTCKALKNKKLTIPLGVSIGQTNKNYENIDGAISDILQAFKIFENEDIKNSFYELNISCPNLHTNISFYETSNLDKLLKEVKKLKILKPIFIKMPINETDSKTLKMIDIIVRHNINGVIIGNLQKDRTNEAIIKSEIKWKVGNFSGLPTQKRSDDLIKLVYKHTRGKLFIVGCGGVFSAEDAYRKIKNGASLIQLITGLIYEGPTLIAQINKDLVKFIEKDGYKNISEAVGKNNKV